MIPPNKKISKFLRIDLAGQLSRWQRKYARSHHVFDSSFISLSIMSGTKYSVLGVAICSDQSTWGMFRNHVAPFYHEGKWNSYDQAFEYLLEQAIRASQNYPDAQFYISQKDKSQENLVIRNGSIKEEEIYKEHHLCSACEQYFPDTLGLCPHCGEPILGLAGALC